METYAINALMPLKVVAVISDLLIRLTSGMDSKYVTSAGCMDTSCK